MPVLMDVSCRANVIKMLKAKLMNALSSGSQVKCQDRARNDKLRGVEVGGLNSR